MQLKEQMKLLILASHDQQKEISIHIPENQPDVAFAENLPEKIDQYDACFFLNRLPVPALVSQSTNQIFFINEVIRTLNETGYSGSVIRMNGWHGFLERKTWEVAGDVNDKATEAIHQLGREFVRVKDVPGLVSARVIVSIINEAYKALDEKVSTPEDMDMALKLGTNYPFGPFEWSRNIGKDKVYQLLRRMAESDSRYMPLFTPEKTTNIT